MHARNIVIDSRVYERLVQAKHEGESFSETIGRSVGGVGTAHTGSEILRALEELPPLSEEDAAVMLSVLGETS
jgi:predicted CopG family antitoxin